MLKEPIKGKGIKLRTIFMPEEKGSGYGLIDEVVSNWLSTEPNIEVYDIMYQSLIDASLQKRASIVAIIYRQSEPKEVRFSSGKYKVS